MKLLVVGGGNNAGLAVVQSLGKLDCTIDVAGVRGELNKCFYSRFINKKFYLENPEPFLGSFCDKITSIINSEGYDFIIPTNDRFTLILSLDYVRDQIRNGKITSPDYSTLISALDKANALRLAQKFKCPIPSGTIFTDDAFISRFDNIAQDLLFPLVLKPRFSWWIHHNKLTRSSVKFINNPEDFKFHFFSTHELIPYPIIQNQIRGDAWGIELLAFNGTILTAFSHMRVRETNPLGSFSSAVKSIPINEVYFTYIEKIIEDLNWSGVCMFEFKNDDEDGLPKLIEINGRLWGSLPLAIVSGVDFPQKLVQVFSGKVLEKNFKYIENIYARWLLADIIHLIRVLRGKPRGWTGYYPKRIETLKEFCKFSKYHSFNNECLDPLPGIAELILEPLFKLKRKIL